MRRLRGAVSLLLAAGGAFYAQSAAVAAQEYELKAAFLFNFAKFVEWPPAWSSR